MKKQMPNDVLKFGCEVIVSERLYVEVYARCLEEAVDIIDRGDFDYSFYINSKYENVEIVSDVHEEYD